MMIMWLILTIRLSSVFLVQTWFVPDEFWQSLEVSHNNVFGNGYFTWEFEYGLRSFLPISIYNFIFKILGLLGQATPSLIVTVPRIIQAVLFSYCEVSFCQTIKRKFGTTVHNWVLFFLLSSWFLYYTCSRTLANTTELSLLQLALCGYGWGKEESSSRQFYIVGFVSCLFRPTAVVPYIPLSLCKLMNVGKREIVTFFRTVPYLIGLTLISVGVDSYMYSRFVISQWNFLKFNVLSDGASFFGTHHIAWYFTEGLLPLLGPLAVVVLAEGFSSLKGKSCYEDSLSPLRMCLAFTCVIYSLQPHKEHRFLLPILPIFALIGGIFASESLNVKEVERKWLKQLLIGSTLVFNFALGAYFSLVHQRAPMDVVRHLATLAERNPDMSVLMLLPCHSTPLYSHIHYPIQVKHLTCQPNFEMLEDYLDEADQFFNKPNEVTESLLKGNYSHVVIGSYLGESVFELLRLAGYELTGQFFHQLIPDGRVGRFMYLYRRF